MGLNIQSIKDLLALIHADDLVIFADSLAEIKKKLRILSIYCRKNGLLINASKTKIIPVNRTGDIKVAEKQAYYLGQKHIEVNGSTEYLDIEFKSSTLGLGATEQSIRKARIAPAAVSGLQ